MALKSLRELNHEFMDEKPANWRSDKSTPAKPKIKEEEKIHRVLSTVASALFYLGLIIIFLLAVVIRAESGNRDNLFGFSFFTVLSGSMQDELPKGSLIVVRETDPQSLKVGDNITFMHGTNTAITHKITQIQENHYGDGIRGFTTKGTNNMFPDPEIVSAADIIGAVTFSIPLLGSILAFIANKPVTVFLVLGAIIAVAAIARKFLVERTRRKRHATY